METDWMTRVLDLAVAIQQIPAPTFHEAERAAFVRERLAASAACEVSQDEPGNVYARLPGSGKGRPLVVSAHLDTVFPLDTDLQTRREPERLYGPGIGDNSLGIAGLFGLLWALEKRARSLPGDLWLVGNVCEEGLGDLRGMTAVVERFGGEPRAYLVLEGMALGQVYHRGLGVKRLRITVRTQGGHSWVDYGRPSAVHELAALIAAITALPLPGRPRTTLNVGVICGGTTVNTIAAEAHLELDLRSESESVLEEVSQQVEALAEAAGKPGVAVRLEVIGRRPAGKIPAAHPLVGLAKRSLEAQGIRPSLGIGSTDANAPLSRGYPAVCVGVSTGGGAHTREEYIHPAPVAQGLAQLVALVEGIFQEIE
jgi:acetylornithine deacetylase/succinyl-diaminopimelate desuccinylase-like protein